MEFQQVTGMEVTTLAREAAGLPPLPLLGLHHRELSGGGAAFAWPVVQGADGPELLGDDDDVFDWRAADGTRTGIR